MAGRLRLAVTGVQDQWLTGDPKISYFSSIYKRHTRFSTEAVGIPITGNVSLGGNAIARIPNNVGDLLRSVMLKLTLGELPSGNLYNASVATSVIQYVDLVIGGQTIQRLTGDYIDMYNQLHSNKDDADTTLYYMNGHNNQIQIVSAPRTFYLNLPFYFFRNPSLAIPICAITRQLIEIHIKFKDVDDDVTFSYEEVNGNMVRTKTELGSIVEASIITDFYFITRDEINFLLTRPMQYIITQLQLSTMQFKPNETKKSALLKFTNPVKELFFSAKEETGTTNIIESTDTISQLGNDIDSEAAGDYSGTSVSMSSDGTRMAVGAYGNDGTGSDAGHVRVYDWNSGTSLWTQVGQDIDGEAAGDYSGHSVSISSDGTRVAIGAYGNDGAGTIAGHVRVFEWNSGTSLWTQVGLDINGGAAYDYSGRSVSMSSDGTRVAIGASRSLAVGGAGHARVFYDDAGTWTQVGNDIDGEAVGDLSGWSVSMSSDGTRVAIGAYGNDGYAGHVRVYAESSGAWSQVGSDIDGEAANDYSGYSVSISSDGTRVAIGAYGNDGTGNLAGHARVYAESSGAWSQVGADIDGEAAGDQSGISVSISSDGTRVAIGANWNSAGYVRVYAESSGAWSQVGQDIDGEVVYDQSGISVSMSSDGARVAVGASHNDGTGSQAGHVRVYSLGAFLGTSGGSEDRLLNISSSDQAFSSHVTNKRSDYRFVKNIRFECNGKRIFDHTGKYLAYEQSLIHHTGCPDPAYEFYTYSFALKPELYYPTGQLNMSRIIHKKLDVELDETSTSRNINFSIYALNYNLLHVEGGIAGLKF
jgi:hypothetical protein